MRRSRRHANDAFRPSETLLGSRIPLMSLIQTLAVAEHLNFRHAANALGVAQSSVSARVKALEQDLGILLFERHARGVRLTEAGRHFVEQIAAGVDQLDHAVKTAGMAAAGEWGRLRIGVHALIPHSFLTELIGQYREDHPGIEVEITEGTARDAVMRLRTDRLDVVFVAGKPELPDCHTRPIWTEPLMAILSDGHRLAGRWPAPSILRFDVERATLLSMVGQGFGVTIAGAATALLPTSGVAYLSFADEPKPITFSAVWSPSNRSAALRNLLTLASDMGRPVRTD